MYFALQLDLLDSIYANQKYALYLRQKNLLKMAMLNYLECQLIAGFFFPPVGVRNRRKTNLDTWRRHTRQYLVFKALSGSFIWKHHRAFHMVLCFQLKKLLSLAILMFKLNLFPCMCRTSGSMYIPYCQFEMLLVLLVYLTCFQAHGDVIPT